MLIKFKIKTVSSNFNLRWNISVSPSYGIIGLILYHRKPKVIKLLPTANTHTHKCTQTHAQMYTNTHTNVHIGTQTHELVAFLQTCLCFL